MYPVFTCGMTSWAIFIIDDEEIAVIRYNQLRSDTEQRSISMMPPFIYVWYYDRKYGFNIFDNSS